MKSLRRTFVNGLIRIGLWGWISSVVYPVFAFLKAPSISEAQVNYVKVAKVDELPPGEWRIIKFGRQPVILIRLSSGDFRAFSAICTHLSCIVQYRSDLAHIWCACHNGHYDLQGRNIAGPPPRPLEPYVVSIVDDDVIVSRESISG